MAVDHVVRTERTNAIRVLFDSFSPVAVDPSGFADALNPSNYTITRTPEGFAPRVSRVVQVAADDFRLELETALEPGVEYEVAVSDGIADADAETTLIVDPMTESTVVHVYHADDYLAAVGTWPDRKGTNHATQATEALRPVLDPYSLSFNFCRVVDFAGTGWVQLAGQGEIVQDYYLIAGVLPRTVPWIDSSVLATARAWFSNRSLDQDLVTGGTQAGTAITGPNDLFLGFRNTGSDDRRPIAYGKASPASNSPSDVDFDEVPTVHGYRVDSGEAWHYRNAEASAEVETPTFVETNPRVGLLGLDDVTGTIFDGQARVILIGVGTPSSRTFDGLIAWVARECGIVL